MKKKDSRIPIIDLFAGPGGLGEGFSSYPRGEEKRFKIQLSIEKEPNAHKTLTLRAFFRQFPEGEAPKEYYEYVRGDDFLEERITWDDLEERFPDETAAALDEARCLTLGKSETEKEIHKLIKERTKGADQWVLVGGPPCQVYSLAGRSRRLGFVKKKGETKKSFEERKRKAIKAFEEDDKQKLYEEYRKILADHWPSVFVMENVKGILSARDKVDGEHIFPKVLEELRDPGMAVNGTTGKHTYRVYSFSTSSPDLFGKDLKPRDYVIRAERFGVPQARHRVILLGVRNDLPQAVPPILDPSDEAHVNDVISDLPRLDSAVSKRPKDDVKTVISHVESAPWFKELLKSDKKGDIIKEIRRTLKSIRSGIERGGRFLESSETLEEERWRSWFHDPQLRGVCNHQSRRHKESDLERYLFSSCYAEVTGTSPKLGDFPLSLLPDHKNVSKKPGAKPPHADRFRAQCGKKWATTITCHIAKDGHYNIHPQTFQVRSLSVREAARIQTFPDNYFFEGGQTSQYQQVGNAVPPYLAHQLASVVCGILDGIPAPKPRHRKTSSFAGGRSGARA